MVNLLVVTTLFPNKMQPRHGIFVETRLRQLLAGGKFSATVIAPVPWFPCKIPGFANYSKYAEVPKEEERFDVKVYHPRYLVIPKIGFFLTPLFLALAVLLCVKRLVRAGLHYDLIDAHYYFPDGVSAALVSRFLDKPVVVTARGSDINLLPDYWLPRKWILWASGVVDANITVSQALKTRMLEMGFDKDKVHVIRNGVDLDTFRPSAVESANDTPDDSPKTLLSAGNLVELKGHDLVIKALAALPDYQLLIAGSGEMEKSLRQLSTREGVAGRVKFLGTVTQEEMVDLYQRADILVLASSSEGMPNVVLESIACGTPVIAAAVGGVPEIIKTPEAGVVLTERSVAAIVSAVKTISEGNTASENTRAYSRQFGWSQTIPALENLYISNSRTSNSVEPLQPLHNGKHKR